jgi:hypothetical protein
MDKPKAVTAAVHKLAQRAEKMDMKLIASEQTA